MLPPLKLGQQPAGHVLQLGVKHGRQEDAPHFGQAFGQPALAVFRLAFSD
jgi:hypothetical protein